MTEASTQPGAGLEEPSTSTRPRNRHDPELQRLRLAIYGAADRPGLVRILPELQIKHRRELRREERWSKEELVRHPDPRQLIRAMRKAGNLDDRGLPVYTLDERRFSTADVHENRYVRGVVDEVRQRVLALLDDGEREAIPLLQDLERARAQASFLGEVGAPGRRGREPTTTLMKDPIYRAVVALRV
ncbi:MAG: DUF2357 domain-containing protein [Actinomycetota bacterium]